MGKFAGTFIFTNKKEIKSDYIKLISKSIPKPVSVIPTFINVEKDFYLFGFVNHEIVEDPEYDSNIEYLRTWCNIGVIRSGLTNEMNVTVPFDEGEYDFYVKRDEY